MGTFIILMVCLAALALLITLIAFGINQRRKERLQNPHDDYPRHLRR